MHTTLCRPVTLTVTLAGLAFAAHLASTAPAAASPAGAPVIQADWHGHGHGWHGHSWHGRGGDRWHRPHWHPGYRWRQEQWLRYHYGNPGYRYVPAPYGYGYAY